MSSKKYKSLPPDIARLRLEAIFHPKFENESPDSEIRRKMLDGVASGRGYLEASLKHSGSLLLWSGRQCYYSKNSTNNTFTKVGEIMLMRHFARCHGTLDWRGEYERCSELVYGSRLTCSFEVVTSVLGHHGAIPERDYLILISVADRGCGRGRFYSTNELVRFAQAHRLPHNDAWIFSSSESCGALFRAHEELMETGTATTVVDRLDRIVLDGEEGRCAKVASLYPHKIFQGDILEGIVIRYVPYNITTTTENGVNVGSMPSAFDELKELGTASNELLMLVPPSATVDDTDDIQRVDLRALAGGDDFDNQLDLVLRTFHGPNYRRISNSRAPESSSPLKSIDVVKLANEIIIASTSGSPVYDRETVAIARLIHDLDRLRIGAAYNLFDEHILDDERFLCILRIHNDSSFPKYNSFLKRERKGGLMLFRGFSIEIVPSDDSIVMDEHEDFDMNECQRTEEDTVNEEKLMLKMKFLPYMVRTFICRNGLSILMNAGIPSFEQHAIGQLTKWKVSDEAVEKWLPFFKSWAKYCTSSLDASLPPLTAATYLYHYNRFDELYATGLFQPTLDVVPSFRGLIVLVGTSKNDLKPLSLSLSSELQCPKIVEGINQVTEEDLFLLNKKSGRGLICIAEIKEGVTRLRGLAKKYQEVIFIIMVQGADLGGINENSRKMEGMTNSWKKTKCNLMLELPKESAMQIDADSTVTYLSTNTIARDVLAKLKGYCCVNEVPDERPGLIVYFPTIPGSGKSSICRDISSDTLGIKDGRKLVLLEGDQIKGKFYGIVAKELLDKPSSVSILDKNVPPTSFPAVHELCVKSKSIALPVLPMGMVDTYIGHGESADVYPFSLQFLAACMSRVLNRKPGTHAGKLDAATENACMVVVKFYCFYRHLTAAQLTKKLRYVGYQGKVIFIPFFKDNTLPELPCDLKQALEDAVDLQSCEDKKICKADKSVLASMDERLRSSIKGNQHYIDSLTVPIEESRSIFVTEVSNAIASLPDKVGMELKQARTIQIVSLDFESGAVNAKIEKLRQRFTNVDEYFAQREAHKNSDQDDESKDRFITSLHCTFAHASGVSQTTMLASFQHLIGSTAEMKATALLFNEKIAAIELEVPNCDSIPRPENAFPHITIWCSANSKAYESNELPGMLKCNKATRVAFEEDVVLRGVFSFWYNPVV
ncbi:hypothetical protein ACHAXA_000522 [Cyclostephanos tholiformis]|uniref:tRNA ligase phosphodiesterase domain-containing protein n=1 Tax=Cyclostephanos tholiformis TaxID=382380 RepID=A0ABD3SSQ8_9STRA